MFLTCCLSVHTVFSELGEYYHSLEYTFSTGKKKKGKNDILVLCRGKSTKVCGFLYMS